MKLRGPFCSAGISVGGGGSGGSVIPAYVAKGVHGKGAGSIVVFYPAGVVVDDILILLLETLASDGAPAAPAGWTEVTNSPSTDSTFTRLQAFWKRATTTYGASDYITLSDAGDHQMGIIVAFRNCYQTDNPWEVTAAGAAGSATVNVSVPTVTTTGTNRLILAVASSTREADTTAEFSGWTNANLTGITEIVDFTESNGNGGGIGAAYGFMATAAATGATTATSATATRHACLTIALKGQTG